MSQASESLQLGFRQLWRVAFLALIASAAVSILMVLALLPKELQGNGVRLWYCAAYFTSAFMANLAAAGAVYLISYSWIRRWRDIQYKQLAESLVVIPIESRVRSSVSDCLKEWSAGNIREYQTLSDVDWKQVILSAEATIDICVQGWDGLVSQHRTEWAKFFRIKKGQVNLFLPFVPENIQESATLSHMAKRLKRSEQKQVEEIRDTVRILKEIRDECNVGEVRHHPIEDMIWYCLVRVDKRVAYISLYEHVHGAVTDSPTFEVWLDRFPATKDWIEKEINGLRPGSSD